MAYYYLKALHIIFVVTWFAGLFYIVRLFVHHVEALEMKEPDRSILVNKFQKMERGLWLGITYPSMILTLIFGFSMVYIGDLWTQTWMMLKFGFVFLLLIYHFICGSMYNKLSKGKVKWSSLQLRMWNEVATVFLFAIVFIVIFKNAILKSWSGITLIILFIILMSAVFILKKRREKN